MSQSANSPRVQRRQDRTRQRILDESARLYVAAGFENVSVEDIITAADISRSSFYRFFANREEVLSSIIQPLFRQALDDIREVAPLSPDEIMDGIANVYLGLWGRNANALRIASRTGGVHFYLFEEYHNQFRETLGRLLRIMQANGLLLNSSAEYSASLIARLAVPMLEVYSDDAESPALFRNSMRGLLMSREKE